MTNWEFPCSGPVDIDIDSWPAGSVAVSGQPTQTITVEVTPANRRVDDALLSEVRVTFDGTLLQITGPRGAISFRRRDALDVTVKAPAGSRCSAKTASADVSCVGELGALRASTASGDVTAATVTGELEVQTASGDVLVNSVGSDAKVSTASGDVQLARIGGEAQISTASGDVILGQCASSVSAHTASGDVDLRAVSAGRISANSASGDLTVGVVPGISVYLDLASTSGDISSALAESDGDDSGPAVEIKCRTLSGDVRVRRAPAPGTAPSPETTPTTTATGEPA
jgi:hypothetical protein